MAVQVDPPIQIDPNMDNGHQWAFVNQNFQSIAQSLSKSSFVIVSSGTVTATPVNSVSQIVTVAHGLSGIPWVIAAYTGDNTQYAFLPWFIANTTSGVMTFTVQSYADATNINFYLTAPGSTISAITSIVSIKYYILQQSAN